MLKKVLFYGVLFVLACCYVGHSEAKELKIKDYLLYKHDMHMGAPQTFIFNKQGDVIFFDKQLSYQLRKGIDRNKTHKDSEVMKNKLTGFLSEPLSFGEADYTLWQIVYDEETRDTPCEACIKQLSINKKVVDSLEKKGLKVAVNIVYMESVSSFIKDW